MTKYQVLSGEALTKKSHLSWQICHKKSEQYKSSLQSQMISAVADPGEGPQGARTPPYF